MTWETFYLTCFFVGLGLSALSFLAGGSRLHLPFKLHLPHAWGHALPHVQNVHAASDVPFFNFSSATAFLCWFGGMGYLLLHYGRLWASLAFALSVLFGLGGAAIVFWFFVKFLLQHEHALEDEDFEMTGIVGVLSSSIRAGGTGEMIFVHDGKRCVAGARSEGAASIEKNAEVVVTKYEKGIAYVRPWKEFAEEHRIHAPESSRSVQ